MVTVSNPAPFGLADYAVVYLEFEAPQKEDIAGLSVSIEPLPSYDVEAGRFILDLDIVVSYKAEQTLLRLGMSFLFQFQAGLPLADIPPYFYQNSVAIVYPYIRATASSVVMLSNRQSLILPLLNLVEVGNRIKEIMHSDTSSDSATN